MYFFKALIGDIPFTGNFVFTDSQRKLGKPRIGYVPQKLEFDHGSPISVIDLFSASLARLPVWIAHAGKAKEMTRKTLEMVNAENLLHKRLGNLSGEITTCSPGLCANPIPDLLPR